MFQKRHREAKEPETRPGRGGSLKPRRCDGLGRVRWPGVAIVAVFGRRAFGAVSAPCKAAGMRCRARRDDGPSSFSFLRLPPARVSRRLVGVAGTGVEPVTARV